MGAGALLVLCSSKVSHPWTTGGTSQANRFGTVAPHGESTTQRPKPLLAPSLETLTTGLPQEESRAGQEELNEKDTLPDGRGGQGRRGRPGSAGAPGGSHTANKRPKDQGEGR